MRGDCPGPGLRTTEHEVGDWGDLGLYLTEDGLGDGVWAEVRTGDFSREINLLCSVRCVVSWE